MCWKKKALRALGNGECGTEAQLHFWHPENNNPSLFFPNKDKVISHEKDSVVQSNENPCYMQPVFRRQA